MTRCGFMIDKSETLEEPYIRWDPITKLPIKDKFSLGTHNMYLQAQNAFLAKDCQRGVFFLGAMIHYIGDASYYGHMIDGVEYKLIFKHVEYLTCKP